MPFYCARAVCATFCAHISPALMPIFGPTFPSLCVDPEAPAHGRMIIAASIIVEATAQAEAYRLRHSTQVLKSSRDSYSPQQFERVPQYPNQRDPSPNLSRRLRIKRTFGGDSPFGTPSDTDMDTAGSDTSSGDGYFCTPVTPGSATSVTQVNRWKPHNKISHSANSSLDMYAAPKLGPGPHPWLSAIPRSTGLNDLNLAGAWRGKRRAEDVDADDEYDGEESPNASLAGEKGSTDDGGSDHEMADAGSALMQLRVEANEVEKEGLISHGRLVRQKEFFGGQQAKRLRRATSA